MSIEEFGKKYAQSWSDTPPHVRKLWLDAWQAASAMQAERVRELEDEARELKEEYEMVASIADMIGHDRDNDTIKELAMLVKRLSSALRVAIPKSSLPDNAMNYLHRLGVVGSPLRDQVIGATTRSAQ